MPKGAKRPRDLANLPTSSSISRRERLRIASPTTLLRDRRLLNLGAKSERLFYRKSDARRSPARRPKQDGKSKVNIDRFIVDFQNNCIWRATGSPNLYSYDFCVTNKKASDRPSGGAVRLHNNQLLYGAYFEIDEDDIRNLDRRPLSPSPRVWCRDRSRCNSARDAGRLPELHRGAILALRGVWRHPGHRQSARHACRHAFPRHRAGKLRRHH
jgi:hypothetical protein